MAIVSIDPGNGTGVQQVDIPGFDTMSPADQQAAVGSYHQGLVAATTPATTPQSSQPAPPPAQGAAGQDTGPPPETVTFSAGGHHYSASVAGYSSLSPQDQASVHQAIVDEAHGQTSAAPQPAPDTSYTGALGAGIHNAAEGFGRTAELVGNATGLQGVSNFGKGLEGATAAPQGYQPTDLAGALRAGDYKTFLSSLPRAAVESAPDLASYLGAGAIAGPVGVASVAAARNLGDNVAARAANNNDAVPTTGDWVGGGLTTATQAALAAVGIGKAGPGAALIDAAPVLAKPIFAGALDATGAAGSDAVGQLGTTVDTTKGTQFDPYEAAAAGAQAGVARAASAVPELAAVGIRAGSDRVMGSLQSAPVSQADAASILRVNNDFQTAKANAEATQGTTSPQSIFNSLKADYVSSATDAIGALRASGQIDAPQARSLTYLFNNQALRSNNTISAAGSDSDSTTLFDRLNDLPIDDASVVTLQNAARDLNTLSGQSFQNRATGPFQAIGAGLAKGAALGGALASGHPAAMAAAVLGLKTVSPIGGAVGAGLDRLMGTNTPPVLLRARAAQQMLGAGVSAGPSSLSGLQDITAAARAIPPAPPPTIAQLAQQRLDNAAKSNAIKLAIATAGKMPTPHPEVDETAVDAAVNAALLEADQVTARAGNVPIPPSAPFQGSGNALGDLGIPADAQQLLQPTTAPVTLGAPQATLPAPPVQAYRPSPVAAPAAAAESPAALPPMTAPAAHPDAPGWERYVANGNPNISRQDVHDAVSAAYPADHAAAIQGHPGGIDAEVLRPIQQQLGMAALGQGQGDPSLDLPADPSVARPLAYALSAQRNYQLADQAAADARAIGMPETADAVLSVAAAHGETPAETSRSKIAVRDAHLAGIVDAAKRKVAAKHFSQALMTHGSRHKGAKPK